VKDPSDVQLAVDRGTVGKAMPLTVEREGRIEELSVRPAELPRRE